MNSNDIQQRKLHPKGHPADRPDPGTELSAPDANVGEDGECVIAPHPESTRPDTGEPCDDGRGHGNA